MVRRDCREPTFYIRPVRLLPGRQLQALPRQSKGSSTANPGLHRCDLEQHAARLAEVDRLKVLAVPHLGDLDSRGAAAPRGAAAAPPASAIAMATWCTVPSPFMAAGASGACTTSMVLPGPRRSRRAGSRPSISSTIRATQQLGHEARSSRSATHDVIERCADPRTACIRRDIRAPVQGFRVSRSVAISSMTRPEGSERENRRPRQNGRPVARRATPRSGSRVARKAATRPAPRTRSR